MGRIDLHTLSDFAKHGYDVELWCRTCGHKVIVTPEVFFAHGVLAPIDKLEKRLKCRRCGARNGVITATSFGPSQGKRPGKNWADRS